MTSLGAREAFEETVAPAAAAPLALVRAIRSETGVTKAAKFINVSELSDDDLRALMELFFAYLQDGEARKPESGDFWSDMLHVLDAERLRRRREVLELERLYFVS